MLTWTDWKSEYEKDNWIWFIEPLFAIRVMAEGIFLCQENFKQWNHCFLLASYIRVYRLVFAPKNDFRCLPYQFYHWSYLKPNLNEIQSYITRNNSISLVWQQSLFWSCRPGIFWKIIIKNPINTRKCNFYTSGSVIFTFQEVKILHIKKCNFYSWNKTIEI